MRLTKLNTMTKRSPTFNALEAFAHNGAMELIKTLGLFVATAVAEIIGCYLPYSWLKQGGSAWLLLPAVASLALFAWLLTLHPTAAGRVYAAYGGVYIAAELGWLWIAEGVRPDRWDAIGAATCLAGAAIILWGPRSG